MAAYHILYLVVIYMVINISFLLLTVYIAVNLVTHNPLQPLLNILVEYLKPQNAKKLTVFVLLLNTKIYKSG